MTDAALLARFTADRPRLAGIAYRMLGSRSDADDLVQETWLRWERDDRSDIGSPEAWWTTTITRLAIDRTRGLERRKETYVGPWLPEPVMTSSSTMPRTESTDPADVAEMADSLTFGFLVLLESLSPLERAVFLLVEVFGESCADAGTVVDRSEVACRQIVRRARQAIRARRHRQSADRGAAEELMMRFMSAATTGNVDDMARYLVDEPVLISDGGANVRAARRPVVGTHRVTRLISHIARHPWDGSIEARWINDEPALVVRDTKGQVDQVVIFEIDGDRIARIFVVRNPDKLERLDLDAELA